MTHSNTRRILLSSALSLALGAAIATTSAGASEIILHEAVNDYSDSSGSYGGTQAFSSGREFGDRLTILDESRHDYNDVDVAAYSQNTEGLEQVEIAVFETVHVQYGPAELPWDITPLD
ncbi:MAG: hypothetical protein U9R74_16295 [Pseudomonadota bacterium]|nr:hypothetical protein [Pseudomonadota bacterium]